MQNILVEGEMFLNLVLQLLWICGDWKLYISWGCFIRFSSFPSIFPSPKQEKRFCSLFPTPPIQLPHELLLQIALLSVILDADEITYCDVV